MDKDIFLEKLKNKDRVTLGKAFTLIESKKKEDNLSIRDILKKDKSNHISWRIGVTGAPGVGKSSFINSFGSYCLKMGKSIAVLAIDPSSQYSGGSILGDKTRMNDLISEDLVFVRPVPSKNNLGGVSKSTLESILLFELAEFDIIFVETVGTGQSEFDLSSMVDLFLFLVQPGLGDDLQGMKRGILESINALIVNKADLDIKAAQNTLEQYKHSLNLLNTLDNYYFGLHMQHSADACENFFHHCQKIFKNLAEVKEKRAHHLTFALNRFVENIALEKFLLVNQNKIDQIKKNVSESRVSILDAMDTLSKL